MSAIGYVISYLNLVVPIWTPKVVCAEVWDMYKRYEPTERVLIDREMYLDWMSSALTRCRDQTRILHLRGIGGIGKTALMDHWNSVVNGSILVDCGVVTDFYDRLDSVAKGAVRLGIQLRRFDLLWSIRLRFVKGVEPAKEPGRSWALEVVRPLPFIGSMVNISDAIRALGGKLSPVLKRRFGDVATWLQTRLGKNYTEELLEILWQDPRHAEFLFLDALLEDINQRKNNEQAVLMLFDQFDSVDDKQLRWRYGGRNISELELWCVFVSMLENAVGLMASRQKLPKGLVTRLSVDERELTELDEASSSDLLVERGVMEKKLQSRVVEISSGNPFLISAICDMAEMGEFSVSDVDNLYADTLEEVRLKTWRRLFSQAEGLLDIIDCTGVLPFFNRKILEVVVPHLKTDHWDRLTRLSFVQDREDGTWDLHDLAKDLVIAELGDRLPKLVGELSEGLEQASVDQSDIMLRSLAFSAQALADEPSTITKVMDLVDELRKGKRQQEVLPLLDGISFKTERGRVMVRWLRGRVLQDLARYAEAELEYREVLPVFKALAEQSPDEYQLFVGWTLSDLSYLLNNTGRHKEATEVYQEALPLLRDLVEWGERPMWGIRDIHQHILVDTLFWYGVFMSRQMRYKEAETANLEALALYRKLAKQEPRRLMRVVGTLGNLSLGYLRSNQPMKAEKAARKAYQITRRSPPKGSEGWWSQAVFASLLYLPLISFRVGKAVEGEGMLREALTHCRELAKGLEKHHMINLGVVLNLLGITLRHTGQLKEAEDLYQEALEIYRGLYAEEPKFHALSLAMVLDNLAILYRQTDRVVEAEKAQIESIQIHRGQIESAPEANLPLLAIALNNHGVTLRHRKKLRLAEKALREALEIRRSAAARSPKYSMGPVATTLNNLGVVHAELKQPSKAEKAFREALKYRQQLATKAPSLHQRALASTLNNLAFLLKTSKKKDQEVKNLISELQTLSVTKPLKAEQWADEEEDWVY